MRGVRQSILDGTFARLKEDVGELMQRGQKPESKEAADKKRKKDKKDSRMAPDKTPKNASSRKGKRAAI